MAKFVLMITASLVLSNRDWLIPVLCAFAAAAVLVAWTYFKAPAQTRVRALCTALKLTGFALLLFCLLEPLWTKPRARTGANFFAVVADNSQGMQIKDAGADTSRAQQLRDLLAADQSPWQAELAETFRLRRFFFDSRLQSTRDFAELDFDGHASSMGSAFRTLAERYQGQPIAGILLFTDGNATDLPSGFHPPEGLPPVYPVMIGKLDPIQDVSIQSVAVTQTAFEDAPVTVQTEVSASGYAGRPITARLFKLSAPGQAPDKNLSAPVASQTQTATESRAAFRFQIRPEQFGLSFYRLDVQVNPPATPEETGSPEATLLNNSRIIVVNRGYGPNRILYVAGRPNWEYKFLNRALSEDRQLELVGLIRVARREAKFEFRGRRGESSNPLFKGFDKTDEETERYDEPVLVRLNTRDKQELISGFPKTAEDLFGYHAVIFDDIESEFFKHDQLTLLEHFVSQRGGAFLMLGGIDSFREGNYQRTPVAGLLPVYLDRTVTRSVHNLRFELTREGWLQPWVRLHDTEPAERQRLDAMPTFQVVNLAPEIKPGATVLATVTDASGHRHPALAVQRFGFGRTAAMALGDLWRWELAQEPDSDDLAKAWRQMLRWLTADVPRQIELAAERSPGHADQGMLLQVRARNKKFEPLETANVVIEVTGLPQQSPGAASPHAEKQTLRLQADISPAEPGLFEVSYIPRLSGAYAAEAIVTDEAGVEIGRAVAGWTSEPAAEEFRSLQPNVALLESIAHQTGGELVPLDQLEKFVRALPSREAPITEQWSFPVWHTPALFLLAFACLLSEWGIRRWKGLA